MAEAAAIQSASFGTGGRRRTGELTAQRESDKAHSETDMGPRTNQDERIDRLLAVMEAQQGNGKQSRTVIVSMWFAPLVFVLSLGYNAVTQNNRQQFTTEAVQAQVTTTRELQTQENLKLWATVQAQDQLIQNLKTDIAVLKDRMQRK